MLAKALLSSLSLVLVSGATLAAQNLQTPGGIAWPGVKAAPDAVVVQTDATTYDVYVPGFMTVATASGKDLPTDEVGTGIGLQPGTVRKVDGSEFDDDSDGDPTDGPKLFPFATNLKTALGYQADPRGVGLVWSGFHCTAAATIPGYHRGSLRFIVKNVPSRASLITALTGAVVAVSINDNVGNPINNARMQMKKIRTIHLPQILYYKFTRAAGNMAVNFAWPYAGAPTQGTMYTTGTSAWAPGRYGSGLSGGDTAGTTRSYCTTGWNGELHGSMTVAWWMKQRGAIGKNKSIFFTGTSGLSCYTGGTAGNSLRLEGYASGAAALQFKVDIQSIAAKQWIHITLRIDEPTKTATLFVMGKAVQSIPVPGLGGVHIPINPLARGTLVIGAGVGANIYDLDEFRFFGYPETSSNILTWPAKPLAAATPYAEHGDFLMTQNHNPPTLGNSAYELWAVGPPLTATGIVLGAAQNPPFNILGHNWYNLPIVILIGATDSAGRLKQPLPIPNFLSLKGVTLHDQAFMVTNKLKLLISNAQATALEQL